MQKQRSMSKAVRNSSGPPAIVVGGDTNALSVARRLGQRGIEVHALTESHTHVRYSRYSRWVAVEGEGDVQTRWREFLTGEAARELRGGALLPCSDEALEMVARHRAELAAHYLVSEANDQALLAMLDKSRTYALAREAGVPAPETWSVRTMEDLLPVLDRAPYPCFLKPSHAHLFKRHFAVKMLRAENRETLLEAFRRIQHLGLDMIVTEIIPGGEDRYCSYYSYLDEDGQPLFDFTKRKLRQYPLGSGTGTYHMTDWNPEVAELGLRFLQGARVRGLGNPEFKRDPRDGVLKLIECNSRFTACNEILNLCGLDLPLFIYNRLTGRPLPPMTDYRRGVRVIVPLGDYLAFRSLKRRGELSWRGWIGSLVKGPHTLYFRWSDPWPSVMGAVHFLRSQFNKRIPPSWRRALSRRAAEAAP